MDNKGLTLDTFGEIVNRFITDAHITMMIEMPEGTQEPKITCTGVSAVDFYVLMAAIRPIFVAMIKDMGGRESIDAEGVIDGLWKIIREDILKQLEGL